MAWRSRRNDPGPRDIPWPTPEMPGGIVSFANFNEWQRTILDLRLRSGVPRVVTDQFDRALKLSLVSWLDFDLVTAGEQTALATLEYSLRDRYLDFFFRDKHNKKVIARAKSENRNPLIEENFRSERISLAKLLQHMHRKDGLKDDQLPCVRKYGGSVVKRLTGEVDPSLAAARNVRAHGIPFGSGYQSGLIEAVRDLIEYAYREWIEKAGPTDRMLPTAKACRQKARRLCVRVPERRV